LSKEFSEIKVNYVDYPFMADFFLPNEKIILQVLDKNKINGGVENILAGYWVRAENYFKLSKYRVSYIEYSDFDLDEREFLANIKKKINL